MKTHVYPQGTICDCHLKARPGRLARARIFHQHSTRVSLFPYLLLLALDLLVERQPVDGARLGDGLREALQLHGVALGGGGGLGGARSHPRQVAHGAI